MAKIHLGEEVVEIPDGTPIKDACEKLGVQFGCTNGYCRVCEINVLSGYEHLSEPTENEEFMGVLKPHRLACQCKIKKGDVKIKLQW